MPNMTEISVNNWNMLKGGDLMGSVINVYTVPLGVWFYVIILLFTMSMVQLKTQNFSVTTIIGIMISSAAIPFLPEYTFSLIAVMIALGISMIMYKLFK